MNYQFTEPTLKQLNRFSFWTYFVLACIAAIILGATGCKSVQKSTTYSHKDSSVTEIKKEVTAKRTDSSNTKTVNYAENASKKHKKEKQTENKYQFVKVDSGATIEQHGDYKPVVIKVKGGKLIGIPITKVKETETADSSGGLKTNIQQAVVLVKHDTNAAEQVKTVQVSTTEKTKQKKKIVFSWWWILFIAIIAAIWWFFFTEKGKEQRQHAMGAIVHFFLKLFA
jgi:ATP-dependent Zn protease